MDDLNKLEPGVISVILDTVPSMLAYWDRDLICRYANNAYLLWFGVSGRALIGTPVRDLLGPDLFARNEHHMRAALRGETQEFERLIPGPHGVPRPSLTAYLPHIVDGEVQGFIAHVTDVSLLQRARSLAEQSAREANHTNGLLRKAQDDLKLAQRLGEMGSWCWEIDEDIVSWSEQLYVLFGLDPMRQPPSFDGHADLYTPQSFTAMKKAVEQTIQTGIPYQVELEYLHRTGRRGWLEVRGAAERDANGRVVRLHGTAQEITGRRIARRSSGHVERIKQLEAELAAAQEKNLQRESAAVNAGRVAAGGVTPGDIAQGCNNVLNSLCAILQLAQRTSTEAKSIQQAVQGTQAVDRSASLLTRRLMNVARRYDPIPSVVKLVPALSASQDVFRLAAGAFHQIEFEMTGEVEVLLDEHELEIAVLNLIINARDAMDTPGTIRVTLEKAGPPINSDAAQTTDWVAVAVADTGRGMEAETMRLACEPFFTTKGSDGGTGLGLAMARAFAISAGGRLTLDSTFGVGTTARLVLPARRFGDR